MKNLILVFLLALIGLGANAQLRTLTVSAADDTLSASGDGNATITIAGTQAVVSFQTTILKNSGTVAGTATLEGSHAGSVWVTVPGASVYTITNVASQSNAWVVAPSSFLYYRIRFTNTTGSFSPSATAIIRK